MTTLQLPNQIVIDDRPAQLRPHIDALQAYERASAELLARAEAERRQLQREQAMLSVAGLAALIIGVLLGIIVHPSLFLFALIGVGLMAWAARGPGRRLRAISNNPPPDLTGRCAAAGGLLTKLRDDLARGHRLAGQVDLRPIEQFGQVSRQRPGRGGITVSYLSHPWLNLDLRLADGNELRLKAIERLKLHPGHYRLGSVSKKRKWKPARRSFRQQLALRLRINPTVYAVAPARLPQAPGRVGRLRVLRSELQGHELRLLAEAETDRLASDEIFSLLRQAYAGLRRR